MLMTSEMFYKKLNKLMENDDSVWSCVSQIMNDFELDGEDVFEWICGDKTLIKAIEEEFKYSGKKINIMDLF